jgi:outer membrane protein assembly factor BamB
MAEITGEKWQFHADGPIRSTPLIADGTIIFGCDDGNLYALDEQSGKLQWKFRAGTAINGSALAIGDIAYVTDADSTLYAVEVRSGKLKWVFRTGASLPLRGGWDFFASSPAYWNGMLFFGAGDGNVYAVNLRDGKRKWAFQTTGRVRSSPVIVDGGLLVGGMDGHLYKLEAASGHLMWRADTEGLSLDYDKWGFDRTSIQSSPAVSGGEVIVGSRDASVYGFDLASGKPLWQTQTGDPALTPWVVATPLIVGGEAIFGSSDGHFVEAVSLQSGKPLWTTPAGSNVLSSALLLDGSVLAVSGDGNLYDLDATSGAERWRYAVGGRMIASPVAGRDAVFVADDRGALVALAARRRSRHSRAFYWEDRKLAYRFSFPDQSALKMRLRAAGYRELGWDSLESYLRAQSREHDPGVVVFLSDYLPEPVVSTEAGTPLFRRFLDNGGKAVWTGLPPGGVRYDDKDAPIAVTTERVEIFTGIRLHPDLTGDILSRPTQSGQRWGLRPWSVASWTTATVPGLDVLAVDREGHVVMWHKTFSSRPASGFVQYWMIQHQAPQADELMSVAEYGGY